MKENFRRLILQSKIVLQLMEQLVDIVYYMYQEIHDNFGASGM
jgi:hypothetical protein